jgi:hypothetical protein
MKNYKGKNSFQKTSNERKKDLEIIFFRSIPSCFQYPGKKNG